jgi:hypothetical protein
LVSEYRNISIHEKEELKDEKLTAVEKAALRQVDEEARAEQNLAMPKIITAVETFLKKLGTPS